MTKNIFILTHNYIVMHGRTFRMIIMVEDNEDDCGEDKSDYQVLLVHGWLDNCHSFIRMGPEVSCHLSVSRWQWWHKWRWWTIEITDKENIADGKFGFSCCCPWHSRFSHHHHLRNRKRLKKEKKWIFVVKKKSFCRTFKC